MHGCLSDELSRWDHVDDCVHTLCLVVSKDLRQMLPYMDADVTTFSDYSVTVTRQMAPVVFFRVLFLARSNSVTHHPLFLIFVISVIF